MAEEEDGKLGRLIIRDLNGKPLSEIYYDPERKIMIEDNPEKNGYDVLQGCKNVLISGGKITCEPGETPNVPNAKPKVKDQGKQ